MSYSPPTRRIVMIRKPYLHFFMLLSIALPLPCAYSNTINHLIRTLQHTLKKKRLHRRIAGENRSQPKSDEEKKDQNLKILIGVACTLPVLAICGSLAYRRKRKKQEAQRRLGLSTVVTVVSQLHQKAEAARARMTTSMMSLVDEEQPPADEQLADSQSWATPRSTGSARSRTSRRSRRSSCSSAQVHPMPPPRQSSSLSVNTTMSDHSQPSTRSAPPQISIDDLPSVVRPRRRHSSPTHRNLPPSPTAEEVSRTPGLATRRLLARRQAQVEQGANISVRDMWAIARGAAVVMESHGGRHYSNRLARSAPQRRRHGNQIK